MKADLRLVWSQASVPEERSERSSDVRELFRARAMEAELWCTLPFRNRGIPQAFERVDTLIGFSPNHGRITNLIQIEFSPWESLEPLRPVYLLLMETGGAIFTRVDLPQRPTIRDGEFVFFKVGALEIDLR